ncbi:unnamed protein product [Spirodela intermedia]|uniref:Uncharacterized protein n=1 Tax=Spirodela intermedia TaxID=51605 RepID=A0A7I8J6C0_SPIIN|nr:unnamed protein product [Spirodela intermedia]CAA6665651.1 unnamed protein product [Spirodela intermedia]
MKRSLLLLVLLFASFFRPQQVGASPTAALARRLSSLLRWTPRASQDTPERGGKQARVTPHTVRVSPEGELIAVDSVNSNIVRITPPLSQGETGCGSFQGYSGHVDGKSSDARFNHPKGVTMDGKGNIYVADTSNMAIRKIGESGVTTIAGGKSNAAGYRDGPSEDARFSSDFDVIYVGSICSLLVVDRGNAALRQIFLQDNDCAYQYSAVSSSDIILVVGAVLVGYVSCLIQLGFGASLLAKKRPIFGGQPSPVAEKLRDKQDAPWPSCRRILPDLYRLCAEMFSQASKDAEGMPEERRGRTPVLKQKSSAAAAAGEALQAAHLKQQKNLKSSLQRDSLTPIKHRKRQEFTEFYGLAARHHETRGSEVNSRPAEVNSVDRKLEHFNARSKYAGLDSRHQSRSAQRVD